MTRVSERDLDLVLFGATGFTGRQAARYLAAHAPAGVRWGVAGRDAGRVEAVRREHGAAAALVADSQQPESVAAMVARTRVLLSTAGPFARYGTPVVEACAEQGVHYCDITGETPWVRGLIDRFHERAAAAGTRIVPCCGFDSVPSDLGTWMVVDWIRRTWDQPTRRVLAAFSMGGGGLNGGTLASALAMAEAGDLDLVRDPVLLNPPSRRGAEARAHAPERSGVEWEPVLGRWLAPFVMAPVNTRVVRRSAALAAEWGAPYGEPFTYDEALATRRRPLAWAAAAGMAVSPALLARPRVRRLLERLGPAPGEGPSERAMERGWFRCLLLGEARDDRLALAEVSGQGDPGNRATVTFLCEAGLALALEQDALPGGRARGGVLTPATALGEVLVRRLQAAGLRLSVERARTLH